MSQAFTQGFIIKDGQRVIDSSVGALTVQGNVNIGANSLQTTDLKFVQITNVAFQIANAALTEYRDLYTRILHPAVIQWDSNGGETRGPNVDNNDYLFMARNNGVGLVEVAKMQGAASPAFCVGNSGATANDDFASIADQVKLGNYDIAAGRRTLALATEEAVAIDVILASTHTLSVRLNGTTYKILLST
jgi:hypothetical protein